SAPAGEGLRIEEVGGEVDALGGQVLRERRADARRLEAAPEAPGLLVDAFSVVEQEQVLEGDHVALHALDLGDVGDPPGAVPESGDVHDQVDGRGDLLPDGPHRQVDAGHQHHRLDTGEGVTGAVGVDRGQRPIVAGVHRLEHVERLGATTLTDDDPVGTHTQGIADQVADGDRTLALDVRRAGLQGEDVLLMELQLGGVLYRDDSLVGGDVGREDVQGRRLAGAGTAGDDDV